MSSKFFNNVDTSLFKKFQGIVEGMPNFHSFLAVVGYFRSSGYFKLRKELTNVQEIRILVGINIDNIFRKHNQAMLFLEGDDEAKKLYTKDFIQDVKDAEYSPEVEEGILQLCDDIVSGKVQLRIHKSKNLHAKFYLCLPQNFSPNTDGWVIMGSSNISEAGLGITEPPRYELNVAMKDYDDVSYCKNEFEMLWNEGVAITSDDIQRIKSQTHVGKLQTPYEVFIKVLIDAFGDQVEDDFTLEMPKGYMSLKYQSDAVIQGFQMLKEYNGFFLADVVGTGKTIVASMIAKRFVEENGRNTHILVIYPPAVKENWEDTFKDFGLKQYYRDGHPRTQNRPTRQRADHPQRDPRRKASRTGRQPCRPEEGRAAPPQIPNRLPQCGWCARETSVSRRTPTRSLAACQQLHHHVGLRGWHTSRQVRHRLHRVPLRFL